MNMRLAAGVLAVIFALALTFLLATQTSIGITGAAAVSSDISMRLSDSGIAAKNLELRRSETEDNFQYEFYDQYYQGIPVYGGKIGFVYKNNELVYENNNLYKNININIEPILDKKAAIRSADMSKQDILADNLVILPKDRYYYLAYKFDTYEKTFFVDAVKGRVIYELDNIIYDELNGTVNGTITPEAPSDIKESRTFANLYINVTNGTDSETLTTDANGVYGTAISGNVTIDAVLSGPYVSVINEDANRSQHTINVTTSTTHNWDWSVNDTSADYEESNVFYHINKVHDFFTKGEPFNITAMDYQMLATVEYNNNYCNAFYSSNNIYFGNSSTCGNLALMSDVIYHEYTHGVIFHIYDLPYNCNAGWESSAMHEGFADYFAATINGNPCAAEEFQGAACLRELNNSYTYPDSWVYECHDDSRIFSGAMWDLREMTNATFADALIMRGIKAETQNLTEFLEAIIAIDDDNGNLTDGTPNIEAICDSFTNNHGILSDYCAGFTTEPITLINSPLAGTMITRDSTYDINGTAYNAEGAHFRRYTIAYKAINDSVWSIIDTSSTPVIDRNLAVFDTTGLTKGDYEIQLVVVDSSMTKSMTKTVYVTDAAIYCENTPCIANSSLIKSRDSIMNTSEPNQPNTIDACLDGTGQETGGYMHDESLENITITSDIGKFRPGTNITVNIWGYCYDGVSFGHIIDYMKIIYSNSSDPDDLNWRIISGGNCTAAQVFQNFSTTFTLDNKEGYHSIRGIMQLIALTGNISSTCSTGAYDDADDVIFYVAPLITGSTPANGTRLSAGTTSTTIKITTDEQAICKYDTSDKSFTNMHDMDTTNSTTHELDVDSLEDGESYDYYFRCNDSYGYTMDSSYHLTFSVKTSSSGGGSGGTTIIETFDVSPGESKITELSIGGGSIAYNNDDETHTIKLSGVIGNTAEFTVTSTPIKVLLKVGETEAIDVNDNGQNDLELTLLSLIGTSAKLKFKLLAENIIKPVVNPITNRTADSNLTTPPPKTAAEQQPATEHNKILLISISIAIAVIIWVIIGQLMKSKKRKERWELIETY